MEYLKNIIEAKPASGQLVGINENAFSIIGHVLACLKRAGWTKEEREHYATEAMSGDYSYLLFVSQAVLSSGEEE